VATAGSDRTVYVYDTRTWKAKMKWRSPCKNDILHLTPGTLTRQHVYVGGSDNELLLCDLTAGAAGAKADLDFGPTHAALPSSSKLRLSHHRGIRAEAKWLGIDSYCMDDRHVVTGVCNLGKLYVLDHAERMKTA